MKHSQTLLVAALAAHRRGRKVVVLSKAVDTATFYAQGGSEC